MEKERLTFTKRIKQESAGYGKLSKEFVERERREQVGHLIALVKKLGRGLSQNEYRELGNIL